MLLRKIARPMLASWFVLEGVDVVRDPMPHAELMAAALAPCLDRIPTSSALSRFRSPTPREWVALTRALNELNRSMGEADLYPFVLPPAVIDKLAFVDRLVREAASGLSRRTPA